MQPHCSAPSHIRYISLSSISTWYTVPIPPCWAQWFSININNGLFLSSLRSIVDYLCHNACLFTILHLISMMYRIHFQLLFQRQRLTTAIFSQTSPPPCHVVAMFYLYVVSAEHYFSYFSNKLKIKLIFLLFLVQYFYSLVYIGFVFIIFLQL